MSTSLLRALVPNPRALWDQDALYEGYYSSGPASSVMLSQAGVTVTADNALKAASVYRSVRLLTETVASLPLIVYQRLENGGKERARNHPLHDVLYYEPNRRQNSMQWREWMMIHCILRSNSYSEIIPGERGPVNELEPIHPDRVTVRQADTGLLEYEVREDSGQARIIPQERMFHLMGPSLDGLSGFSTISAAGDTIGLAIASASYAARYFSQGTRPGGYVKHPGILQDKGRKNLRESMEAIHQGLSGAHRLGILEEGMEYKEVGHTAEQAQFLETRKFLVTELARFFGVPPHMVMDLDRATFANIEHQSIEFVIFMLRPWLVRWEQAIQQRLILAKRLYFAEFLVDGLLRGDLKSRYEAHSIGINTGWLTRNEVRRMENMNPLPGLDMPQTALNMAPVQQAERIARAAAERVVRKEVNAALTAARRLAACPEDWRSWVRSYYARHAGFVAESMGIDAGQAQGYVEGQRDALLTEGVGLLSRWEKEKPGELVKLAMGNGGDRDADADAA